MTDKQTKQFNRLKSIALSLGAKDDQQLDDDLILQMKTLCLLDQDETDLLIAEDIVDNLKAEIVALKEKNRSDTSRLVGILLDNDKLKERLNFALAEIEKLKSGPDLNDLVKAKIDKEKEEVALFEQLKKNAGAN